MRRPRCELVERARRRGLVAVHPCRVEDAVLAAVAAVHAVRIANTIRIERFTRGLTEERPVIREQYQRPTSDDARRRQRRLTSATHALGVSLARRVHFGRESVRPRILAKLARRIEA